MNFKENLRITDNLNKITSPIIVQDLPSVNNYIQPNYDERWNNVWAIVQLWQSDCLMRTKAYLTKYCDEITLLF